MNILVTNDDGILAPGLALLADVCREVGTVTVVAPDREQSGTSHSLTLHRPLRPARRPDGGVADRRHAHRLRHARDPGAHAGAAQLRVLGREPRAQHGRGRALLGHRLRGDGGGDARRARASGSRSSGGSQPEMLEHLPPDAGGARPADHRGAELPRSDAAQHQPPQRSPPTRCSGIQVTKLGSRYFSDSLTRMKDPWGREIFWIGGGTITWTGTENSDHLAVAEGLRVGDPAPHGSHELLAARDGQGMVAGGLGEGDGYGGYRSQLVETLRRKGIRDLAVLRAVGMVPRHLFVPESVRHRAYDDVALPISGGQTISQPWVQARYLELAALTGRERVLEIGAGSGYQTALLTLLADAVFAVERIPALAAGRAERARGRRDPQRHRARGRRHPRLAPVRSLRRHPGGRGVARRAGAAGRAARARRAADHSARRPQHAGAHARPAGGRRRSAPAPWPTCASSRCSASSAFAEPAPLSGDPAWNC